MQDIGYFVWFELLRVRCEGFRSEVRLKMKLFLLHLVVDLTPFFQESVSPPPTNHRKP